MKEAKELEGRNRLIVWTGAFILVVLLIGAAIFAGATLWPRVIRVEQRSFDAPARAVGTDPGVSSLADAVEQVCPAIVHIYWLGASSVKPSHGPTKAGGNIIPPPAGRAETSPSSDSMGSIISIDGYVLTIAPEGPVVSAEVLTSDGRTLAAQFIASDPQTGLALLKLHGTGYPFLRFARSTYPQPGEWVVSAANPTGRGCAAGVSAVTGDGFAFGAPAASFIAISPPIPAVMNGAPVLNTRSRAIGIASSKGSLQPDKYIAAALPAGIADRVAKALKHTGKVPQDLPGVLAQDLTPTLAGRLGLDDERGALVAIIDPQSAAFTAGLRAGDVIKAANGRSIDDAADLDQKAAGQQQGYRLDILRNGTQLTLNVPVELSQPTTKLTGVH